MTQRRDVLAGLGTATAVVGALPFRPARAAGKRYTIGLVPGLTTDAFYTTMHRGASAAAASLGVDLVFQGAPAFNPVSQVPVLDALVARKPDALLVAPTDKTQLIQPLKNAADAGIPVITVDTYIGTGEYGTGNGPAAFPLSYIASDNTTGGALAADALARAINGAGKVYVANIEAGVSTTDQREAGFKAAMARHAGITVLPTEFNDDDANKAASQAQSVLARHPDLAGIFGANLFSALGAGNGVQQSGKTGAVKVIAFDAPQSIVADLRSGLVTAAIAQHPAEIGWFGVAAAFAHLSGQSIPPKIATGFTVIDKTNVDDPAIKRFLYAA